MDPPDLLTYRTAASIHCLFRFGSPSVWWIFAGTPAGHASTPIIARLSAPESMRTPATGRRVATDSAMPSPLENPAATRPSGKISHGLGCSVHQGRVADRLGELPGLGIVIEDPPPVLVDDAHLVTRRTKPLSGITDPAADAERRDDPA